MSNFKEQNRATKSGNAVTIG